MHQVVQQCRDEKGLKQGAALPPSWRVDKHLKINLAMYKKIAQIKIAEQIFKREYNRIIDALGGTGHHLVDQYELQRLGHPYYNSRAAGGEGHLEVAKNIYYSHKGLAHMVLAMKPFGCMPSTQSDGAQSAVMSHYKDMIFLPIETSGEGDVNAHSRVQMALGEAKAKTKLEFKAALEASGRTLEEIRAYVAEHPELKSPMYKVPRTEGVVGVAANFLRHVAQLMKAEHKPTERTSAAA
jgi:predicted nucleotide-binding protein (sugar kinase/HSP70/actin superfamily)